MTAFDEAFIQKLRATFRVEAEEHLQAMSARLLELEKGAGSSGEAEAIEAIYREAHSLKGAARAVDLTRVEAICQSMENVFAACKREKRGPAANGFDILHQSLDRMRGMLSGPGGGGGEAGEAGAVAAESILDQLKTVEVRAPGTGEPSEAAAPEPEAGTGRAAAVAVATPALVESRFPAEAERALGGETVRISVTALDSHLMQVEELLGLKGATVQRAGEVAGLRRSLEQMREGWVTVGARLAAFRAACVRAESEEDREQARIAGDQLGVLFDQHLEDVRGLEGRVFGLEAQAVQDRQGIGRKVDELLEDSKKLLMMPFSTLAAAFPKVVRDLCRDQGKEAELVIRGGGIEIDKRILEAMKDPLIHVLRNCVDHGVEPAAERMRLGKPAKARIVIAVSAVNGSKVEIVVSDDGAGVNLERVRRSAVEHGLLTEAEAAGLDEEKAHALVFRSEVTASAGVTAISGRGLGMAIVRAKAEALGGRISISSKRHAGTVLRMLLPHTLATFRGLLVKAGDQLFVVPTTNVERTLLIKVESIKTVENREVLALDGQTLSLARLSGVLGLEEKARAGADTAAVIVLASTGERMAFMVEEVLYEAEVLVKSFEKPIVRVRNIAGATVLGTGGVAPVLNVSDLLKSARSLGAPPAAVMSGEEALRARRKRVLVVEDSITSRMLLKGVLESAGYEVKTAVDGVDGFTRVREEPFDVVVSDVEMPRMNGFDLTAKIRLDKRLSEMPVVLVTALESREQRERGIDAGANAYIVKSTFDRGKLLEVIGRLVI